MGDHFIYSHDLMLVTLTGESVSHSSLSFLANLSLSFLANLYFKTQFTIFKMKESTLTRSNPAFSSGSIDGSSLRGLKWKHVNSLSGLIYVCDLIQHKCNMKYKRKCITTLQTLRKHFTGLFICKGL